jgi:hypothetical protein
VTVTEYQGRRKRLTTRRIDATPPTITRLRSSREKSTRRL